MLHVLRNRPVIWTREGLSISLKRFISFREEQDSRRKQALKSIVLKHKNTNSEEAVKYCQRYGKVANTFHFNDRLHSMNNENNPQGPHTSRNYTLVEFQSQKSLDNLLDDASYFEESHFVIDCRILYLRKYVPVEPQVHKRKNLPCFPRKCDIEDIDLMKAKSVLEQMQMVYDHMKMSELDIRMRYFIYSVIEESLQRIRKCNLKLYGSSVTGFGVGTTDLDMVLFTKTDTRKKPVYFMHKKSGNSLAKTLADVVPQVQNVKPIYNARVPIVKFDLSSFNLQCDISFNNLYGVTMAEYLHSVCHLEPRIPLLAFTIREWARYKIVQGIHTMEIKNFMILLLLIHFLQVQQPIIVPRIDDQLMQFISGPRNVEHKGYEVNISVLSPVMCYQFARLCQRFKTENTVPVEQLLKDFFTYYASFDFSTNGISIIKGKTIRKNDDKPMYIENPVEKDHNICRNVTFRDLRNFQKCCEFTSKCMEENEDLNSGESPWGIMKILGEKSSIIMKDFVNFDDEGDSKNELNDVDSDYHLKSEDFIENTVKSEDFGEKTVGKDDILSKISERKEHDSNTDQNLDSREEVGCVNDNFENMDNEINLKSLK